jgi:hypothetical protein
MTLKLKAIDPTNNTRLDVQLANIQANFAAIAAAVNGFTGPTGPTGAGPTGPTGPTGA